MLGRWLHPAPNDSTEQPKAEQLASSSTQHEAGYIFILPPLLPSQSRASLERWTLVIVQIPLIIAVILVFPLFAP